MYNITILVRRTKNKRIPTIHGVGILAVIMSLSLLILVAKVGIIFESNKFFRKKMQNCINHDG